MPCWQREAGGKFAFRFFRLFDGRASSVGTARVLNSLEKIIFWSGVPGDGRFGPYFVGLLWCSDTHV